MSQQIELSERQQTVVKSLATLKKSSPRGTAVTASVIASDLGVDSRGVGQTLRRLRDQLGVVEGPDSDGGYKFTSKGRGVSQRLTNQADTVAA